MSSRSDPLTPAENVNSYKESSEKGVTVWQQKLAAVYFQQVTALSKNSLHSPHHSLHNTVNKPQMMSHVFPLISHSAPTVSRCHALLPWKHVSITKVFIAVGCEVCTLQVVRMM